MFCIGRKFVCAGLILGSLAFLLFFYIQSPSGKCVISGSEQVNKRTHDPLEGTPYNISHHKRLLFNNGLELFIHNAFIDDRFPETIVRIFGLQKKDAVKQSFTCKWNKKEGFVDTAVEVKANKFMIDTSWPTWTDYYATTFDCHFPPGSKPTAVDLVTRDGQFEYSIPIEQTLHKSAIERKTLAVCVKPVTGSFKVSRMVEWFEMLRLVGVTDVIMYNTDVTGPARFVLEYYEKIGLLQILPFPYLMSILQHVDSPDMPGQKRYAVYQQTYLVAMHDCLYRFRGRYEHLLYIDIDEILVPTNQGVTVDEMIKDIRRKWIHGAGFLFFTAWHFEDDQDQDKVDHSLPSYMYMHRLPKCSVPVDNQPKSVVVTDRAISVNFHSVLDVPSKKYSNEELPWKETGYIHHFRGRCDVKFEAWRCKELFGKSHQDPVLPRFKNQLQQRMAKILDHLQIT